MPTFYYQEILSSIVIIELAFGTYNHRQWFYSLFLMTKLISKMFTGTYFSLASTSSALALDLGEPGIGGASDLRGTIIDIVKEVLLFMALVAVIVVVIAGVRLVISQGEQDQVDKAKKTIIYAIIGLIIIALASAIVKFVEMALGV